MMISLNRAKFVVNFLVVSSIVVGINSKKFRFHLPWACAVLYEAGHLIGACAIFDSNKVLVSVDNFNDTVPGSNPPKMFYQKVVDGAIYVHAGSNYMNVDLVNPKPKYARKYKASKLSVVFKNSKVGRQQVFEFHDNPPRISPDAGAEYDVLGLAFNVGILAIHEPFVWNPYLQPMLITGPNLEDATKQFNKALRRAKIQRDACVTYSWGQNRIRYHEVMYLDDDYCLELFCTWKLSKCLEFPAPAESEWLKCFKSTKYADVCPPARGAALYCPKFHKSVFAILTTAPSCGLWNMPGVYTTLPKVIQFFEKAYNVRFPDYEKRPEYDLYSLQQRNEDYDGIP